MSAEAYAALPAELALREVRVRVTQRGFRTKTLVIVTTLVDPEHNPAHEIAELYRRRWQAELHLRSLKVVLQMDHLRCKTPHRVRNEFYMHLLAYNLVRRVMALAAIEARVPPWQISFKGTLQTLSNFLPWLASSMPLDVGCQTLVASITAHLRRQTSRPLRATPRQTTTQITRPAAATATRIQTTGRVMSYESSSAIQLWLLIVVLLLIGIGILVHYVQSAGPNIAPMPD